MKAPAEIETERLILRRPRPDDAGAIFERYASDPDVTRFLGWPRHQSVRDAEAFVRFSEHEWQQWPAGPYLILSRADGRLLGGTGLGFQGPDEAITGYVLAADAWGQGFATEALRAMIELASELGVTRLIALCHTEHRPSQRVLEKCAFVRDGVAPQIDFPNLSPGARREAFRYRLEIGRRAI